MRIVIDMNRSIAWVAALQASGHDAVHWSKIGAGDAPDDAIIAWARANAAIVLTRDLDFAAAITRSGAGAPSVVQLRVGRAEIERDLPVLRRALTLHAAPIEQGAIVTLDGDRIRIRVLDHDASH